MSTIEKQDEQMCPQVAPVFILALIENAEDSLKRYLQALGAPDHVIDMVGNLVVLAMYGEKIKNDPTSQMIGIEELTISTINQVVKIDGSINVQSALILPGLFEVSKVEARD